MVDLERGILDFRKPGRRQVKKRRGVVPIGADVAVELRAARAIAKTEYVVEWGGGRVGDIKKGFALAVARAGLPAVVTPHVLKHSVISWLGERGWNEDKAGDMTSTDPKTVRRIYRKVNPTALRPMADELSQVVFAPFAAATPGPAPAPEPGPRSEGVPTVWAL